MKSQQQMTTLEAVLIEAKAKGFRLADLAETLGVSAPSVTSYKRMGDLLRLRTARSITQALSQAVGRPLSVDELFPVGGGVDGEAKRPSGDPVPVR